MTLTDIGIVRAADLIFKGQTLVYTAPRGDQFTAKVLTAHKDGSATILLFFSIKDGVKLSGCYQGDRYRVDTDQLSVRTSTGLGVGRLKFA